MPVFHPTNGREGETAALFSCCPLNFGGLGGGFALRRLNPPHSFGFTGTFVLLERVKKIELDRCALITCAVIFAF